MLAYAHPDDNLLDVASTVTVHTGTVLDGYDVERLNNGSWAYPFKIAGTTLELRFAFAGPVLPAFAILGNTNLTVAAVLEGRSTAVWGSAEVTGTFAVPVLAGDGLYSSPFLDLSDEDAMQYWRLRITSNGAPIIIGELFLGSAFRTLDTQYELDDLTRLSADWKTVRHETPFGVELAYRQAARREAIDGHIGVTAAEFSAVEAWHQACDGAARPCWLVPTVDVNDAWLVRLEASRLVRQPLGAGGWKVSLPVRQLSRGLAW